MSFCLMIFQSQDKNANYPSESKFTGIHTYYKNLPMLLVLGIIRLQALNSLKVVDPPMLLQSIYRTLMKNVIMKNI